MLMRDRSLFVLLILPLFRCQAQEIINNTIQYPGFCMFTKQKDSLKMMEYTNGSLHSVKVPYPNWASAQILAQVVFILLSEVMEYSTVMISFLGEDSHPVSAAAGCQDINDLACLNHDIDNPGVHFTLESWTDGQRIVETLPSDIRPILLNVLDYNLDDGYFMWKREVDKGLNSLDHVVLTSHYFYNADHYKPHKFFDPWTKLYDLLPLSSIVRCKNIFAEDSPYGISHNNGTEALATYVRLTNDTDFSCAGNDTVWFSPSCRANNNECVPLVVMYNFDWAMQRATHLNLPLAVFMVNSWVTGDYTAYMAAIESGRFLFHWTEPDDGLLDEDGNLPLPFELPRMSRHAHAMGVHTTGADGLKGRNFGWRLLQQVDPSVAFLAARVNFDDEDMRDFMRRSRALGHLTVGDPAVQRAACDWIRQSEARWRPWIPRSCPAGAHVDSTLIRCLPCPAGKRCPGGAAAPTPCPEGFFCPFNESAAPQPCPVARPVSQEGSAAEADCSECAGGNVPLLRHCVTVPVLLSASVLSAVALCAAAVSAAVWYAGRKERRFHSAARGLRERLRIRPADGYLLSDERAPLWPLRAGPARIARPAMDAAARLALLRDFDVRQLDAFCAALHGAEQQARFRRWLLELSLQILDPDEPPRPDSGNGSQGGPPAGGPPAGEADWLQRSLFSHSRRGEVHTWSFSRRRRSGVDEVSVAGESQEIRFRYFEGRVARLRVWQDGDGGLFQELRAAVQGHMDRVARLCDLRYQELLREGAGKALAAYCQADAEATLPQWLAPSLDAERRFDRLLAPPRLCMCGQHEESGEPCSLSGDPRPGPQKKRFRRQDDPEVNAIRISKSDRREAELQADCATCLSGRELLDEEVFLAQLSLRARLLDRPFQSRVLGVVLRHAVDSCAERLKGDSKRCFIGFGEPADEDDTDLGSSGEHFKRDELRPHRRRRRSFIRRLSRQAANDGTLVQAGTADNCAEFICSFEGCVGQVLVESAAPKTVARMREKLGKYMAPHPACQWPLSANILDPVRASVVCYGASQMLQALHWFEELGEEDGLRVCSVKNRFNDAAVGAADGYRDVKMYVLFKAACGLRIIGEVQVHDTVLYNLKLKMHKLYKVKRASRADAL